MSNPLLREIVATTMRIGRGISYRSGALQRICRPIECSCSNRDMVIDVLEVRIWMEERGMCERA